MSIEKENSEENFEKPQEESSEMPETEKEFLSKIVENIKHKNGEDRELLGKISYLFKKAFASTFISWGPESELWIKYVNLLNQNDKTNSCFCLNFMPRLNPVS